MKLAHSVSANRVTVPVQNTMAALSGHRAVKAEISGFTVTTGTMDDAFIAITGKEIRE
jgi:multidrug/hemolysin transport system ATP-binding protein